MTDQALAAFVEWVRRNPPEIVGDIVTVRRVYDAYDELEPVS